jgi:uncharacterized protein (TIGR02145 family)
MKRKLWFPLLMISIFLLLTISVCKKEVIPTLTTNSVTDITEGTAICGGTITKDGGAMVTERGVCWSLSADPTRLLATKTNEGYGIGSFVSYITGLTFGKTYHVRAYATNSVGTAYGNDVSFTTRVVVAPAVTTTAISAVSSKAALSGGNVTDAGGAPQISHGVCWSTSPEPTIKSSAYTSEYGDPGPFTSIITGLNANTSYFVRAYAMNSADTSYGGQFTFTTTPDVTDIDGTVYGTVNIGTQVWLTENLATTKYNNDTPISLVTDQTAWNNLSSGAYCWFNNDGPTYRITNGALYNWHAVSTGKLCPAGWHVPTDAEWTTLITFLGGETLAGAKMQSDYNDHNNSLFWAVVSGTRDTITGFEVPEGCGGLTSSRWWSTASSGSTKAWSRLWSYSSQVFRVEYSKRYGFSVRCLKD